MKAFMSEDFLLKTKTAQELYHDYAKKQPIIDYHNHLPPDEVANNRIFENLTKVWLYGDHYKWRAMRTNGISEDYITGQTTDYQKFEAWANTVPYTLGNPLFHWTHLELRRYFDIHQILKPETAHSIFYEASEKLNSDAYSVQNLLKKMNVEVICTTDDPIDSLEFHAKNRNNSNSVMMNPTFRPDKCMAIDDAKEFNRYVNKLEKATDLNIQDFISFHNAIKNRHDYFDSLGCKLSDHGLETIYAEDFTEKEIAAIFYKLRKEDKITTEENLKFKSAMLYYFAEMDAQKGWTQQFHIGAIRNNNSRLMQLIGADCGADSIGDFQISRSMSKFFNRLDTEGKLAKTIIYNLNPRDNELYATMIGNFQDGTMPGKIQFGSGWWFLDQKDGMEKQLTALSNLGLLSRFIGMLTDSRSFLSFPRHEYFRRILCNKIGNEVENGELPHDLSWLGQIVEGICYQNAKKYFNFQA